MKKPQDGFTLVEALLIILILAVMSFAGYYVWDRQSSKDDKTEIAATNKSSKQKKSPKSQVQDDVTNSWTMYETPDKAYAVRLADGLTFMKSDTGDFLWAETLEYTKGQPVNYVALPARDGGLGFSVSFGVDKVYGTERATVQPSLKTNTGIEVKKYKFTQTIQPDGIDIPVGATEYIYTITHKGKTVSAGYAAMDAALPEIVEQMVRTVEIR